MLCLVLGACAASSSTVTAGDDGSSTAAVSTAAPTTAPPVSVTVAVADTTIVAPATTGAGDAIVNSWSGPPSDLTALPIGTSHVSTSEHAVGTLFVCDAGNPNGGGAFKAGPWLDETAGTWDATKKVSVQGSVAWPMAAYSETVDGDRRTITSSGLPVGEVTGTFPIAADDPAYAYDRNPNSIAESDISISLPLSPVAAATPSCLGKGSIGVLRNGVALFAPVDELNRDAVAYETQDACDGHPQQSSTYHYHDVPSCIRDAATGSSTVVGFADDGFPIVVERDEAGNLPTNADLDECHGRTSAITLDGVVTERYHYSVTSEFPYVVGCLHGALDTGS